MNSKMMRALGSYSLCCWLMIGLFVLTLLGTLAQVQVGLHAAQTKYFNSWFLFQEAGPLRVPFPGGITLMSLLALNLFVGGFLRIRKNSQTLGVLIIHGGIGLLLLAGLVKILQADEGSLRLHEGESATHYQSYKEWEVVVRELLPTEDQMGLMKGDEWVVEEDVFRGLEGSDVAVLTSPDLPFDVHLSNFVLNARVLPEGPNWSSPYPTIDGFGVMAVKADKEVEFNLAAIYANVVPKGAMKGFVGNQAILWAAERAPFTTAVDERLFAIEIQKRRHEMPFRLELVDFHKEEHPRTNMAAVFSSDVLRVDRETGEKTPYHIAMNEPLREDGVVAFQSKWGPPDGGPNARLYSIFAVVRNPSDKWPEIACWVIAAGMLITFGQRLIGFLSRQVRQRREVSASPIESEVSQ